MEKREQLKRLRNIRLGYKRSKYLLMFFGLFLALFTILEIYGNCLENFHWPIFCLITQLILALVITVIFRKIYTLFDSLINIDEVISKLSKEL